MLRVLLEFIIPIVLPTVVYLLWLAAERRRAERAGSGAPPRWEDAPWVWLGIAGLVLAIVALLATSFFGAEKKGRYVPPQLKDGQVIPGHVVPEDEPPRRP